MITVELLPPTSYTDDQYAYEIGEYRGTPWAVTSVTTAVTDDDYAFPAISILDADALESEGSIEFTVMLDRANDEQEISVDWATSVDGSSDAADGDADYTAASGTLIFAIGETTKTITITLLDDTLGEATETFNVVLSNPTEVVLEDDTGSGTIRDDESDVAVVFAASTLHVEEGNNVVVTFRRLVSADLAGTANCYAGLPNHCFDADADPGNVPLTINLSVTQVGDFLSGSAPTSITFAAGEKFADLAIPTADDNNVEASGTITVQILQGSGYTALATGTIQGQPATNPARVHNVYDNDLTFTIDDAQADESDGQIDFTVRLNAAALEEVTIDVFTQDGDATSHANVTASSFGKDFEAKHETLIFAVGEQQKTFTVDIADDFIYERNETFTVQLSNPPQYLSLADGTAVGTITDDEEPMIASVSRAYAVVDEGQAGPVRYNIQLTHPITVASERTPAVVWQTVDGTATEGEDYQASGGKLSFLLGTTSGFFDVYLVDDKLLEQPLETFTVELIPGSISDDTRFLSISSTDGSFETSIRDNESLTATISSNAESVAEGQQAVFIVKLIGALGAESVSVTFETAGSAVETDDFGTPTGLLSFPPGNTTGNAGTLEIPAGQSSGTITYPILSDSIEEGDETLTVEIFSAYFGLRSASISETQSVATTTILDQDSLTLSIQGTLSVDEGTAATFTIVMSTVSDDSVTVDWETRQVGEDLETGKTAVPDADYTAASGSVTIPSGSTSATFTVSTLQDTLAEGDETFKVALTEARVTSSTPVEEFPLGVAMATGSIVDDDTAPDGLTMQATPDSVDEDSGATDLTVTVTLDGTVQFPTDTPVTVEFIDRPNVNRNATLGEDYTATTVTVDIPAGQSSVVTTITLTPDDDNIWEGNEIARLTATSSVLSNSDALGVTILENDVEPNEVVLTVAPAAVDEATPTTSLVVTGTLAGGSALPVDTVVTLEAVDDTAVSGDDYEVNMATLTIPAGELSATTTLSLTVLDDNIHEGDEELKVGGTTPGTIQVVPAVVTIQDNDNEPTSIGLSVTAAPIDEGSSAVTIAVEATMLGGGTRNESTLIAMRFVGLTATVGDDFTATWDSSTLTIPAGAFSAVANLTVTPADDTLYEGLEQFAVRGTNSVPGLTVSGVRLSIVDNDPAPTTITLSFDQPSFSEAGEILILEIRATLEGDSTLPIDTSIHTSIASLNGKSLLFHGNQTVFPLTIAAGESLATSEIFLLNADDRIDDGDETIELQGIASNPSLEVVSARTVLVEDDSASVALAPATLNIREGNEGKFYSMRLATEPMASVTVIVDLPTNAAFTVSSGSLTFTPDDWNDLQRITVTATEDSNARDEPAATINHTIASDDTKYRAVSVSSVAVTVRDDDSAGATISEATLTIEEGDSETYTLVLGTEPAGDVTVTIGGVTGTDVTLDKTVLTFTTQNWGTAQTVTVTDDDVPVDVSYEQATYTAAEGGSVTVTVALSVDPERTVTIPITKANQDGATTADYSGVPENVTFNSGDTEKTFTFAAATDTVDDDGESVKLTFGTLPAGVSEGTTKEAVVSIMDDDVPAVNVSFEDSTYTVGEGNSVTVALALSADPERSVTILLTAVGQDGADGDDFSVPTSVTFASGETEQTATFSATQDTVDDDEESVKLGFGTLPTDVSEGSTAETTVSITDDDVPAVSVSFEQGTYTVDEGKTVTVKVTLSAVPERTVAIPITKTGQAGASNSDYSGVPTSVTFASGETEKAITFSAATDNDNDDGESVKLTFGTLPAGVTAGSTAEATVSIIDDQEEAVEPPPAPQNLSVTANSDGSITLTWDAPDDDSVTGYQILRRRPAMGEDNLIVYVENTGSTATSFIDRDVTAGTRHTYRVKAINEAGPGPRSNYDRVNP